MDLKNKYRYQFWIQSFTCDLAVKGELKDKGYTDQPNNKPLCFHREACLFVHLNRHGNRLQKLIQLTCFITVNRKADVSCPISEPFNRIDINKTPYWKSHPRYKTCQYETNDSGMKTTSICVIST